MPRREASLLNEILPPEERAIETVVARYQRVAPAVTRFARSLSGDEHLRLRLGSQASAAPGEIVLDPGALPGGLCPPGAGDPGGGGPGLGPARGGAPGGHRLRGAAAPAPGVVPRRHRPPARRPGPAARRPRPRRRGTGRGPLPRRRRRPPGGPGHGGLPGSPLGARRPLHQCRPRRPGAGPAHGAVRPGLLPGRRRLPGGGGSPAPHHAGGVVRSRRRRPGARRGGRRPRPLGSRLGRPRPARRGPLPRLAHRGLPHGAPFPAPRPGSRRSRARSTPAWMRCACVTPALEDADRYEQTRGARRGGGPAGPPRSVAAQRRPGHRPDPQGQRGPSGAPAHRPGRAADRLPAPRPVPRLRPAGTGGARDRRPQLGSGPAPHLG